MTPLLLSRIVIPVALAAAAAACGSGLPAPRWFAESPPGSQRWTEISGAPAWVAAPPVREGTLRFVVEGRSNDRKVAAAARGLPAQVKRRVHAALSPVVGAGDAARAADAAAQAATVVERVSQDEVLSRDADAGNTLSTVWSLCEIPLDTVLAPLPPDRRAAARDALEAR